MLVTFTVNDEYVVKYHQRVFLSVAQFYYSLVISNKSIYAEHGARLVANIDEAKSKSPQF